MSDILIDNCPLALGGVLIGFGMLQLLVLGMNIESLRMPWLTGVIFAMVSVACGLRRPAGLILQ